MYFPQFYPKCILLRGVSSPMGTTGLERKNTLAFKTFHIWPDLAAWLEAGYHLEWDWVYISYLFLQLSGANLGVPVLTVPRHFKCFLGTVLADDFERSFSFQVRGTGKASCCLYYPSKTKPKTHHWINGYAVYICYSIYIYNGFSFPKLLYKGRP